MKRWGDLTSDEKTKAMDVASELLGRRVYRLALSEGRAVAASFFDDKNLQIAIRRALFLMRVDRYGAKGTDDRCTEDEAATGLHELFRCNDSWRGAVAAIAHPAWYPEMADVVLTV